MANLSNINNKFLVTTGGNVLIGQTSVVGSSILQATGNSTFSGELNVKNASTRFISLNYEDGINSIISHSGTSYGLESLNVRGDKIYFYTDYEASTPKGNITLTLENSHNAKFEGNVGIGISAGGNNLHIYKSNATALIQASNTSGIAQVQFFPRDASNVAHLQSIKGVDSSLTFLTGGNSGNSYVPTERMLIDSSGRVGIGVTPSYANVPLHTKNLGGGDSYNIFEGIGNAWVFGEVDQAGTKYCQVGGSYGAHSGINIDTVGNVGIGTVSPASKLHIDASSGTADLFAVGDVAIPTSGAEYGVAMIKTASTEFALNITSYSLTGKGLRIYNNGGLVDRTAFSVENGSDTNFVVDGLGQVGISTPALPTDVYTASGGGLAILGIGQSSFLTSYKADDSIEVCQNTYTNTSGLSVGVTASVAGARLTLVDGQFVFNTLPTAADKSQTTISAMKIDPSGHILFGYTTTSLTADPGFKYITNANTPHFGEVVNTISGNGYSSFHHYNTNATYNGFRFYITNNGGIYNYSANNVNLSDERLKHNIENSGDYLNKICSIPVRLFNYKDEPEGTDRNLGVIAQEVEAVAPELVSNDGFGETPEDGIELKTVYSNDMMYALMKAIQELKAEIDVLKSK